MEYDMMKIDFAQKCTLCARCDLYCTRLSKQKGVIILTYDSIKGMLGKQVIVTAMNGKHFKGKFTNTESEFDTESGKEEVEIDTCVVFYGIPLDDIKSMVEVK